jgi:purine-cytosine permease-like protein
MIWIGAGFTLNSAIGGWIAVTIGLSFWQAVSAAAVGLVLGTLVMLPTVVIGPLTGTNMTVASGADYGIRGRFIGSALSLMGALGVAAITVWTSGDAVVGALARLLGFPDTPITHAIGYGIVAIGMATIAIYGHDVIVRAQKIVGPIAGVVMLIGLFAFAPQFDASATTGVYALGSFWPTWALAATIGFAVPVSYAPVIGDYTRRISLRRHSKAELGTALSIGMIAGSLFPTAFGAFTTVALLGVGSGSYVSDLVAGSPAWYLPGLILVAVLGGVGQGVLCIYATGLDTEGLFPRLTRVQTTTITAAIAIALVYIGVFVFDAIDSISALALVMNVLLTPWVVIMVVGLFRRRRIGYDALALQDFTTGRRGGTYWYHAGWNTSAVVSWAVAAIFGVLTVTTTGFTGPFANIAGGIDISLIGSGLIAAGLYALLSPRKRV